MARSRTKMSTYGIEPRWFTVFIFLLVGMFLGGFASYLYTQAVMPPWIKDRLVVGGYQFVNPALAPQSSEQYDNFDSTSKTIEQKISLLISDAKRSGNVSDAGVYYRDLTAGRWIDDNADMQFSAGVRFKVPLMIAYYKVAEQDPHILDDSLHFDGQYVPQSDIFSGHSSLEGGHDYAVRDLIESMIDKSDETAAGLLYNHIDQGTLAEIYNDLGIDYPAAKGGHYTMSLKRYGSFLRSLYTAAYLSPAYAEQALELLAQNKSDSLLSQGIPRSVTIAYRIGGQQVSDTNGPLTQIYECDIVYLTQHDYLLCALARGASTERVRSLFESIGSAVYGDVSQNQ